MAMCSLSGEPPTKGVWKSATMGYGGQCVTMGGGQMTLQLCADNLASHRKVNTV